MKKKEIILIGGGGNCKSCIDVIESTNEYSIAGIIDAKEKIGDSILGYKIIGNDDDLISLKEKYEYAFITIGQIKSASIRKNIYNLLTDLGYKLPVIIAKTAYVSKYAEIGAGTIVMHQALINSNVVIGENCIINSKALIEHDCSIGNHCHISTNSTLNGDVKIGNECFIGSCSTIVNGISIKDNVIIGTNSLVNKKIEKPGTYFGNPCKKVNK